MSTVYPIRIARLTNFARNLAEGLDDDWSGVDAEINQILVAIGQTIDLLKTVVSPAGDLQFTQALREMKLIETLTFTGVAGSSQSLTVPTYNPATDFAQVFVSGARIDPANIAYTDATHITVTYPFVGSEHITVDLSSNGAGALTKLASTAVGLGAALVGINDAGSIYTSTDVEDALQEVMTKLNTLITNIGTIANYVLANGPVHMTGALNLGGHQINNGAAATNPTDFVIFSQLTAYANIWDNLAANFLPLGGGNLTGPIDLANHKITTVATPTATQDAANKQYVDNTLLAVTTPIGAIIQWTATAMPSSAWLVCDGSAVSRTAYPGLNTLFAGDGYKYGNGDGSTTFNLPDLRGRVAVGAGAGAGLTTRNIGDSGGEEQHTLSIGEMPAHTHTYDRSDGGTTGVGAQGFAQGSPNIASGSTGGGTPHNNMQPWLCAQYIIRVQ